MTMHELGSNQRYRYRVVLNMLTRSQFDEIDDWAIRNCTGLYLGLFYAHYLYFELEEDAVLVMLRWS